MFESVCKHTKLKKSLNIKLKIIKQKIIYNFTADFMPVDDLQKMDQPVHRLWSCPTHSCGFPRVVILVR